MTRKRDYVFTVPGALVVPIGDKSQKLDVYHLPESIVMQRDIDLTWIFDDKFLTGLRKLLWEKVKEPGEPLQMRIPTYGNMPVGLYNLSDILHHRLIRS